MSIERLLDGLEARSTANQKAEDYIDPEDGLLHCAVCGKPKQTRLRWIDGRMKTVGVVCGCYEKEQAERREREQWNRTQAAIKRLHQMGVMDPRYLKNRFEIDDTPESYPGRLTRRYVDQWQEMRQKGKGLLFLGKPGTGKTFYSCCVANALIDKGIFAFVTNVTEVTRTFKGEEDRLRLLHYTSSAALMILDDLGAERSTEYAIEQLYSIVDQRYRSGKPLIVTTNLTLDQLGKAPELGRQRIYERVLEMCPFRYGFTNENRRPLSAAENKED